MYKILLVDDELLVRTNLKLLLQKFSPDFSVCGEAGDGESGLKLAAALHPDVIFTDMRMPGMDGVEFCRKVHLGFPDIAIIALSNYDDYAYVRGALKHGARDYILKHKLNEEFIASILGEIRKASPLSGSPEHISDNNLNALREKFVTNLLAHLYHTEREAAANLQMLDIPLDTTRVMPIVFSVDEYARIIRDNPASYLNTLEFSILNIGNEILSQYPTGIMVHLEKGEYCILLSFAQIHSQAQITASVQAVLQQLSSNFKSFLNLSCSFSIGDMTDSILDVGRSFQKALTAMQLKFYTGNHSVLHSRDMEPTKQSLSGLDYALEKKLLTLAGNGSLEDVQALVNQIFQDMTDKKEGIANIQMVCTDMISIITRLSKKNRIPLDRVFTNPVPPNQIFNQLNTLQTIHAWFIDSFSNLCGQIRLLLPGDSNYVRSAIACINRDYAKPISQQSVADEIGISVGYLSTIFKAETGQGFSDYLTTVRIGTATRLLDNGEEDLHKIARSCGFQDYAYFFKVFKKRMGMTPKNYIRNLNIT